MSGYVPHIRPELSDTFRVGLPVGAFDWSGLGALANWNNGHGGMLIPWCMIGETVVSAATNTFHFRVAPKLPAVERVWRMNLRATAVGVTAEVTVGGASTVTVNVADSRQAKSAAHTFRESLSAKTNTVADTTVAVKAVGGNVIVESIAMYEQTRGILDADANDNGVDINSLRARDPIADFNFQSVAGVMDSYVGLDARRAGYFHWSTDAGSSLSITAASGDPDVVFDLSIPMFGAIAELGDSITHVTCAVYCSVTADTTGSIRFASDDAGDSVTIPQTATSPSWVTDTLEINCEDFPVSDGRRGSSWEGVAIDAWVTATKTLSIEAISIFRDSGSNPI